ncbi:Do family serine endopeptidase [Chelativorans sp. ZYF759]|uniref:Do family serine endopeptidase n=1 Tax=Chelativorans sp. ZYF759 TaxID=2692213 RepID=UPI00145D5C7D|nr:Do family serine endopeptidase [Chelativorans sp. ZYF759]NMG38993.1 Do family serine endopeptidase [Chelativorans sp. ZYF759]
MQNNSTVTLPLRKRLLTAAASAVVASAIGFGAVASGALPVQADPVRVESNQMSGFGDVVEQVKPAVVSVRVESRVEPASDRGTGGNFSFDFPGLDDLPQDHPMQRFFREFWGDRGGMERDRGRAERPRGEGPRSESPRAERPRGDGQRGFRARPTSQGSGFFVSADGYLVTNNHVVAGGQTFTIVLDDGTEHEARLVGTDERTDLAVLKVDGENDFTYVGFADESAVRVGDWVVAVGNPYGLGGTVTAGIVSARGRDIGAGLYDDFIQIDAAVNRGNSGGPAFNLNGEVVGVNTAIFSPSGGNVGIAFAIPASLAGDVVTNLIERGQVMRGWLGVQIQQVTDDIADSVGLGAAGGALVTEAQADGPAREAGVRAGDIITAVDGRNVDSPRSLARVIGSIAPGTAVDVTLWRNGAEEVVSVDLGELPGVERQARAEPQLELGESDDPMGDFGLTVAQADDGQGLVVTDVEPGSAAAERDIRPGDVIMAVNSIEVGSTQDVARALEEATAAGRRAVLVQISRDDANMFVALPVSRG